MPLIDGSGLESKVQLKIVSCNNKLEIILILKFYHRCRTGRLAQLLRVEIVE